MERLHRRCTTARFPGSVCPPSATGWTWSTSTSFASILSPHTWHDSNPSRAMVACLAAASFPRRALRPFAQSAQREPNRMIAGQSRQRTAMVRPPAPGPGRARWPLAPYSLESLPVRPVIERPAGAPRAGPRGRDAPMPAPRVPAAADRPAIAAQVRVVRPGPHAPTSRFAHSSSTSASPASRRHTSVHMSTDSRLALDGCGS